MRLRPLIDKDLRRWWSDRNAVAVSLLLPLLLTGILGISFGGFGGGPSISAIPLAVVGDLPPYARDFLDDALAETGLFDVVWTSRAYAEEQVRSGEMRAALVIPDDFTERYFAGDRVEIILWKDINSEFKAGIVEQILERMLLYLRAGEAAYIGAWPGDWYPENDEASGIAQLLDAGSLLDVYREVRDGPPAAEAAWTQVQDVIDHQIALQDAFAAPAVDLVVRDRGGEAVETEAEPPSSMNMFNYFLPGMAVFFLMFSAVNAGGDLHQEREGGTLRRLLVSPLGGRDLLLGKWLFATLNGVLQLAVLFAVGRLVYGLNLGPDPLALPAQALVTSAALASLFLVLALLTRSTKQMGQVGTGVVLFMAIIGGNFMPMDSMSGFLRAVAVVTPNYWANRGFTDIVSNNRGLDALADPLSVLGLVAIVFLALAVLLLRLRERKGDLL